LSFVSFVKVDVSHSTNLDWTDLTEPPL
jgi:hypothetical protein